MISDKIGDALTRIRNGQSAKFKTVKVMNRKLTRAILDVLVAEGYITSYKAIDDFTLEITLKYVNNEGAIKIIERISKPGCRRYASVNSFKPYFNGLGTVVLSTSHGVMADYAAKSKNIGGELLFRVF